MTSRADQLRQMRRDFEEALALGCSIPDLRQRRLADRHYLRARARGEVSDRTEALMKSRSEVPQRAFLEPDCPWMMRDLD